MRKGVKSIVTIAIYHGDDCDDGDDGDDCDDCDGLL